MIGPLLQGVMLVGVIYFYSKSVLTLINDYYREEFKSQYGKEFKKLEKPQADLGNIENVKGIIINKKDIIPSPTIEGLPDIFNSPERTSFATGRQSSPTASSLMEKLASEEPQETIKTPQRVIIWNSEGHQITEPPLHPSDLTKCSSNHISHSSITSFSSNIETSRELSDSIESSYKHAKPFNAENDIRKHSNKETISNSLLRSELNYELSRNQQQVTSNDVEVLANCDNSIDGIENNLLEGMSIKHHHHHHHRHHHHKHENHYLDDNGNHADMMKQRKRVIVVKRNDDIDKVNEQENRIGEKQQKSSPSSSSSLESRKNVKQHVGVNSVCTSRRKSVNEMIQYWNHQVSLCEENLKVEGKTLNGKRRLSSGEMNGLV